MPAIRLHKCSAERRQSGEVKMVEERRTIGDKLSEDDLAALNLKLGQEGFESVSDFVNSYIDGAFNANDVMSNSIAEKFVQKFTAGTLAKAQPENSLVNLAGPVGFEPTTPGSEGLNKHHKRKAIVVLSMP